MSLPIKTSPRANRDLARPYRGYSKEAGEEVARRYLAVFHSTAQKLALSSGSGPVKRTDQPNLAGIRYFAMESPFHAYLVFYQFDANELKVERIIHGERDLPRDLREAAAVDRTIPAHHEVFA